MNQFSDVLARWLERDVLPNVIELDHADEYPTEMVEQMREFGLFGATIPTEYGGLGLSTSTYAEIVTQISAVWMSLTGVLNSHLMMAHLIRTFGTDEQRDDFLPKLASGELRGGLALTEPTCGTDLQAIRTTARRDGDTYIVNGTKTWITNGGRGNCLALLVKTDLEASPRSRGTSVLLAHKDVDGYTVPRKLGKLGYQRRRHRGAALRRRRTSTPTGSSAASRDAASRRCSAASSSAASTSPPAASASRTPRCRPRCATRTCARRWDGRSGSIRRSS